jgi:predicted ferric reductase
MRELGSQYYCYAAMALWSAALIWRHGTVLLGLARHLARGRGLPRAQFELLPGGLIRMTLRTQMSWKVGQHIFLRVLECRPAETHPFTIASLPGRAVSGPQDTESGVPADDGLNELVLIIRPVDGFTGRLAKIVESRAEGGKTVAFPVLVDGPYGEAVSFGSFDSVVLVAGGSGISFALPILHDILSTTQKSGSCSRINLIWAARDSGTSCTSGLLGRWLMSGYSHL